MGKRNGRKSGEGRKPRGAKAKDDAGDAPPPEASAPPGMSSSPDDAPEVDTAAELEAPSPASKPAAAAMLDNPRAAEIRKRLKQIGDPYAKKRELYDEVGKLREKTTAEIDRLTKALESKLHDARQEHERGSVLEAERINLQRELDALGG